MKAVVLETRGKEAAVLVKDGTVRIVHGSYSVGDSIEYNESSWPRLHYWAAAAAAAVVAIGLSAGLWVDRNYITYAEVSLDVNPSIVYSINKRDRVLSVQAANEDAETIVEQLKQDSIRFTPLSEAVEKTMDALEDEGYLSEDTDDYVLINVSADDETRQDRLVDEVEYAMAQTMEQDSTLEYQIDRSGRNTAREAKNNGMSTGRYAAWQEASREQGGDSEPSKEDYATKPVREIVEKGGQALNDSVPGSQGLDGQGPGGQAPNDSVPGSQAPDEQGPGGQAPNDSVPGSQGPDEQGPGGQAPGADGSVPTPDTDSPESGTESAGSANPPARENQQTDGPQHPEDSSQRPDESDSQRPEGSTAQRPDDSTQRPEDSTQRPDESATSPGNNAPQSGETGSQGGAPGRNDAKDSQNESPNAPGTNTDEGDDARQDRVGDSENPSEKASQSDDKKQNSPSGSTGGKEQTPVGNSDGGKKQTPAHNSNDNKKSDSSAGKEQSSRNDKSDPGRK